MLAAESTQAAIKRCNSGKDSVAPTVAAVGGFIFYAFFVFKCAIESSNSRCPVQARMGATATLIASRDSNAWASPTAGGGLSACTGERYKLQ